jgi:hypothetical protein
MSYENLFNAIAWQGAYIKGYREGNYPVPVTLDIADSSIGWTLLSGCPCDGCCTVCCSNFIDQLWDDYYLSCPEGE